MKDKWALGLAAGALGLVFAGCVRPAAPGPDGAWAAAARFPEAGLAMSVRAPALVAGREARFEVRVTDLGSGSPVKDAEVKLLVEPVKGGVRQEFGLCLSPESAAWQDTDEAAYVACATIGEPGPHRFTVSASVREAAPVLVVSTRPVAARTSSTKKTWGVDPEADKGQKGATP